VTPRFHAIAIALVLAGTAPCATAGPLRHLAVIGAERARVSAPRYWTRARLAAAPDIAPAPSGQAGDAPSGDAQGVSAQGVSAQWEAGGAVGRTTGRVFFTLDGTDYSCSGSTVASANADVVMTAAHCVSDGDGHWATNWIFVPGYRDGQAPYGRYTARAYFAAGPWQDGADENDDVAFVAVNPARVDGVRRRVVDVVGGQRIEFGDRAANEVAFGYPAGAPYDGRRLEYCAGSLSPDPYGSADEGMPCPMTEGGSGGPWFSGFDPVTGLGTITGVTAFRYSGDALTLYATDLGPVAQSLYEQAERA
jgi:V8-like Glu-specific endopeptidase